MLFAAAAAAAAATPATAAADTRWWGSFFSSSRLRILRHRLFFGGLAGSLGRRHGDMIFNVVVVKLD